jgi:hypothetical protein
MTNSVPIKLPGVCFMLLSLTLLLGGLGTMGGFVLLHFYYPQQSTWQTELALAVNGLLCWGLGILSALAGWRVIQRRVKAEKFAWITWWLAVGFTMWVMIFNGLQGWSAGVVVEVTTWGILELLIGAWLMRARGRRVG